MFSITALVRPDPFNGPETHCDLGLQSKVSCDMGLSPVFRTRESMTPVPFYCIFFLMQRQKAEFVFISFCKAPPYVSGLQLRRMQVFGSHAGSRLGRRKPPKSGAGDKMLPWFPIAHLYPRLPCFVGHPTCTALPCMADQTRPSSHRSHSS